MDNDNLSVDVKNIRSYQGAIKLAIFIVYVLGAVFATIMFTQVIEDLFPESPILSLLAYIGAWANFASVVLMLAAKDYWVHGRAMMAVAVTFWIIEVLMLIGNTLVAYDSSWAGWWTGLAPAAPVMVIVIWGVLWLMHPDHKSRQASMNFYYEAQTNLQSKMLKSLNSAEVQDILDRGAQRAAVQVVERSFDVLLDQHHDQKQHQVVSGTSSAKNGHEPEEVMIGTNGGNPTKR